MLHNSKLFKMLPLFSSRFEEHFLTNLKEIFRHFIPFVQLSHIQLLCLSFNSIERWGRTPSLIPGQNFLSKIQTAAFTFQNLSLRSDSKKKNYKLLILSCTATSQDSTFFHCSDSWVRVHYTWNNRINFSSFICSYSILSAHSGTPEGLSCVATAIVCVFSELLRGLWNSDRSSLKMNRRQVLFFCKDDRQE